MLGRNALRQHRFGEAVRVLQEAVAAHPATAEAWADLARAQAERRDLPAAEACLAAAEARGVSSAAMLTFLGRLRLALDRPDDARTAYEAALDAAPDHGDAYRGLAMAGGLGPGAPWRAEAERRLTLTRGAAAGAALAYALAEAAAQEGDHAAFMAALQEANARQRGALSLSTQHAKAAIQRHADTRRTLRSWGRLTSGAPASAPAMVFLLGPPGSGATVVEAALAQVGALTPAGVNGVLSGPVSAEAERLAKRPHPHAAQRLSPSERLSLTRDYLRRLANLAGAPHPLASDSDPTLIAAAPMIGALFANARFVRVRRDPRDSALAVFRRAAPQIVPENSDLEAIGAHARQQDMILDALADHLPLVEARYEDFAPQTADAPAAARALAAALDTPLHDEPRTFAPGALGLHSWEAIYSASAVAPEAWRAHAAALAPVNTRVKGAL